MNKWFSNVFFITNNNWNSDYDIILRYDFLKQNKIILDSANQNLIIGNVVLQLQNRNPNLNVLLENNHSPVNQVPK